MGLTMSQRRMSQRRAVTQTIATRYRRAQGREGQDPRRAVRATTGWHRNHARKALVVARRPRIVAPRPRPPRPLTYGPEVAA
jgi:hypothetical protein